jgi:hypothetical protein
MFIGLCALLKRRPCVRSSHPQSQVRSVRSVRTRSDRRVAHAPLDGPTRRAERYAVPSVVAGSLCGSTRPALRPGPCLARRS